MGVKCRAMVMAGAAAAAQMTTAGAHGASFRHSRQSAQSSTVTHQICHEAESPPLSRSPSVSSSQDAAHEGAGAAAKNEMLPPTDERILTGFLEKKTMKAEGLHWQPRNAVLSADYLSFGKFFLDWYVRGLRGQSMRLTLLLRVLAREHGVGRFFLLPRLHAFCNLALMLGCMCQSPGSGGLDSQVTRQG